MRIELTIFRLQGECLNPLGHVCFYYDSYIILYSSNNYSHFSLSCFLRNIYNSKTQYFLTHLSHPGTTSQETSHQTK